MNTASNHPAAGGAAANSAPALDSSWRLTRLVAAPHRLGFFTAAILLASTALWWAVALFSRSLGIALPWAVPPSVAHGLVMSLGFMPLFIVGFLFTAGPRWLGLPDIAASRLVAPVSLMVTGWLVTLVGFHATRHGAALGVAAVTLGWSRLVYLFAGLLRTSQAPDKRHAALITFSAALGILALGWTALGLATDQIQGVRAATQMALWGFLAPTFTIVAHRMIPFFTVSALPTRKPWRPYWLLWTLLGALWVHGAFAIAAFGPAAIPAALRWVQIVIETGGASLALWLSWRWGLVPSFKVRLLAMLHASFPWLGISLMLSALSEALAVVNGGIPPLGLAPLHALTMGYLGTLMIAMVTRVATGHSGRPLAADNLAWGLYWCLQTATLLRVVAALPVPAATPLTLAAIACWTAAAVTWAWRYGGWLGKPRSDNQPG